jgi:hydroxymethylpyrimidine/phosphomethylpyrimidine kinase
MTILRADRIDPPRFALTIAGSDSGGGAGIQADLKAFAASGVFGTSVITAVTAQNTQAVSAVQLISAAIVGAQIDAVFADFPIGAVKTGMLASGEIIASVIAHLPTNVALVVDPVMIASSGAKLLADDAIDAYRGLIARADLVTPNLPEAETLVNAKVETMAQIRDAARSILAMGAKAVLIKGGHGTGKRVVDHLFWADQQRAYNKTRLPISGHGTGCTLSALIAANLARTMPMPAAVSLALKRLHQYLRQARPIGHAQIFTPDPNWTRY